MVIVFQIIGNTLAAYLLLGVFYLLFWALILTEQFKAVMHDAAESARQVIDWADGRTERIGIGILMSITLFIVWLEWPHAFYGDIKLLREKRRGGKA